MTDDLVERVAEARLQALRDAASEIDRWKREAIHTSAATEAHIQSLNAGMDAARLAVVGLINKDAWAAGAHEGGGDE